MRRMSFKSCLHAIDCDKAIVVYAACFTCMRALMIMMPINLIISETMLGKLFKAMVYAVGFGLLAVDYARNKRILIGKHVVWMLGLAIALLFSECIHYQYADFAVLLKQCIKSGILIFIFYSAGMRMTRRGQICILRSLHNILSVIFIPSIFYMFYQFLTLQHYVVNAIDQGWYEGRLYGILISPYSGAMLVSLLAFGAGFLFHFSDGNNYKALYGAELVVYSIFLALSDTRTAYVACAMGVGVIVFWHGFKAGWKGDRFRLIGKSLLTFLLIVAAIFALLRGIRTTALYCARELNNKTESFSEFAEEQERPPQTFTSRRAFIWKSYFDVLTDKPSHILFGLSQSGSSSYIRKNYPDTYIVDPFKEYYPELYEQGNVYGTHNTYLAVLVYSGLVGLVFLMVFLLKGLRIVLRRMTHGALSPFEAMIVAILFMILSAGFFEEDPFFTVTYNSCIFWICAGFLINPYKEEATLNNANNPILPS